MNARIEVLVQQVIIVPMLVLNGIAVLLSGAIVLYSVVLLRVSTASSSSDRIRFGAVALNTVIFAIAACLFLTRLICAVLRSPSLDLYLPAVTEVRDVCCECVYLLSHFLSRALASFSLNPFFACCSYSSFAFLGEAHCYCMGPKNVFLKVLKTRARRFR